MLSYNSLQVLSKLEMVSSIKLKLSISNSENSSLENPNINLSQSKDVLSELNFIPKSFIFVVNLLYNSVTLFLNCSSFKLML